MTTFATILCLCLIAVTFSNGEVDKQTCRKVFTEMNRRQLGWINQCVKQLGYKTTREKTQKSTCVMKCVLDNLKLLNGQGFIDEASYDKYISEEWPAEMHARAKKTFSPCFVLGGDITVDEFCKGYKPLITCLNRNFANLCKGL